jgi:protein TonB
MVGKRFALGDGQLTMSSVIAAIPDVFTAREIARAAGARTSQAAALIAAGTIGTVDGHFIAAGDAVRAVRILRGAEPPDEEAGELFRPPVAGQRSPGRALAASGALHATVLGCLVFLATLGAAAPPEHRAETLVRLVFLATPGPGGGGGGGGFRQPAPPPKAQMKGPSITRSPVPPPRPITTRPPAPEPKKIPPPVLEPVARPVEPPPVPAPAPLPQVVAPVATAPADTRDRAGVLADAQSQSDSHGSGSGSGAGTGQGTGVGEGTGAGIGPGSGGGTGGGPYRPGSGITAPGLLREVKPDYTEEARRRGVEGDVVLEIVVRSDGSVGNVRLMQGLGGGLDQRAIDAVRQWKFSPARRFGTPVDVMVEVAVEFKLR